MISRKIDRQSPERKGKKIISTETIYDVNYITRTAAKGNTHKWLKCYLVSLLRRRAELVDVRSVVEACRDPKDNYLLALAKDGSADYLITGDLDLLTMEQFEKTKIVKLSEFIELV